MPSFTEWLLQPVITILNRLERTIAMNQQELAQALTDAAAQATKAKDEIVAKVAALEAAILAGGATTPEVDAALASLKGVVQTLDDLNPDAPPAP
jgi:phenylpyruvate tautomerase PptA (4-oxalocrotonate tautomerase family)